MKGPHLEGLRDNRSRGGEDAVIADCRGTAPQKHSQPAKHIRMKVGVKEALEQQGVAHPIEGLRQVCSGNHSAAWGFTLIETVRDGSGEGEEGGYGGATGAEAMLERSFGKGRKEKRADKAFKDLRGWAE